MTSDGSPGTPRALVALVGPTAVGKSQVAVHLAKALQTEVLTADSRQVYRGMDIGTEKPSLEERGGIPHRLIDLVEPDQPFNVGMYRRAALEEIERLYRSRRLPLVVGGTGLYVRALIRGLWDGPSADRQLRDRLTDEAKRKGSAYLHQELARVDPDLAARLHPHDAVKIIRGLEVYRVLGRPLSEVHAQHGFQDGGFSPLVVGLTRERPALYRRVEERVEEELTKGLVRETRALLDRGYGRHLPSMKGLGYRQIAGYLAGEYDYTEAVRLLKRDTRHFAKRQLTWFRQEAGLIWLTIRDGETAEQVVERMLLVIREHVSRLGQSHVVGAGVFALSTQLTAAG